MTKAQERYYRAFRLMFGWLVELGMKVEIKGEKNLSQDKGFILVANHVSDYDPLLLGLKIDKPINWLAGSYLFNMPLIGDFLKNVGAIPVSKDEEMIKKAFDKMSECLMKKQIVGIFPEGWKRIGKEKLGKFHTGFARLALSTGADVLPIGIKGVKIRKEKFILPIEWRKLWGYPKNLQQFYDRIIYERVLINVGNIINFGRNKSPTYDELKEVTEQVKKEIRKLIK